MYRSIFIVGLVFAFLACGLPPWELRTDEWLLANFQRHRQIAETIVEHLRVHTKVFGVTRDDSGLHFKGYWGRTSPESLGLTNDDLSEYGSLMAKLDVHSVWSRPRYEYFDSIGRQELGAVIFDVSGEAVGDWLCTKGYQLGKDFHRTETLVETTDGFKPSGEVVDTVCRRIEDEWYIVVSCVRVRPA